MKSLDRRLEDMVFVYFKMVGAGLLLFSIILGAYLMAGFLNSGHALSDIRIARVQSVQLRFFIIGIFIILAAGILKKLRIFTLLSKRDAFVNIIIGFVSIAVFFFVFNDLIGIKYYVTPLKEETTIFINDAKLGWKFRPNSEDRWQKGTYKINSKGLRCRHSEYEKPPSVKRILQLGDSVTAGFGLLYEDTYPFLLEALLNQENGKNRFEVINAACDGYAAWQEYEFLKTEGIKYKPDLVIIGFVLNDVTEPLCLKRFGGHDIGHQLSRTKNYGAGPFYAALSRMPIYIFLERQYLKTKFGKDIVKGAKKLEELQVKDLVFEHESKAVQRAWQIALFDIKKINDFCSGNKIDLLILIFPYTFQFDLPYSMAYPQEIMKAFCEKYRISYIDFLPIFSEEMKKTGKEADYYFMDFDHPTAEGSRIIARALYEHIKKWKGQQFDGIL